MCDMVDAQLGNEESRAKAAKHRIGINELRHLLRIALYIR